MDTIFEYQATFKIYSNNAHLYKYNIFELKGERSINVIVDEARLLSDLSIRKITGVS